MGIRLIVEVLDHWQDAGLTPGERWDLLVLAENANDGTRLTFGPVHAQHILDRANKSPKGWKNAITTLMRKKVITTHVPGRIKQVAVYHLEHLCPDPPHDGHKGLCTRPPRGQEEGHPVGDPVQEQGHPTDDPVTEEGHPVDDPMGHPADDPLGQEGHPADAKRVIQEVTPTPPNSSSKETPLTTSSSSVAEDGSKASAAATKGGGGGGESPSEDQAHNDTRAAALIAQLDYRGKTPDKQQQGKLRSLVAAALTAGWTENGLRRYLDISDDPTIRTPVGLYQHRLNPDRLPDPGEAAAVAAGLPPLGPNCHHDPGAATDVSLRTAPLGGPCPDCHPSTVGTPGVRLPPPCEDCAKQPGAVTNPNVRIDPLSFDGDVCPNCHPSKVPGDWDWTPAASTLPGDHNVNGWLQLARSLSEPQPVIASGGYQPWRNPIDQSVYDEDL
jgi:hypothetical protein